MNASFLKLLAMGAMLLDHIGWVLLPQMKIFHWMGQLALPIFCYGVAEGYLKTKNVKDYFLRLLGIAFISQMPFIQLFRLCFGAQFSALNTVFNLALGLLTIWIYDWAKFKGKEVIIVVGSLLGLVLGIDGDFYIVPLIFIFYKYHGQMKPIFLRMGILTLVSVFTFPLYGMIYALSHGASLNDFLELVRTPEYGAAIQPFLLQLIYLVALIPIKFYNGEKGKMVKGIFYGFYPLHLIILYVLAKGI